MASGKHTLRLLWETVFPYEIRWGIEEVADQASVSDANRLIRSDVQTNPRPLRFVPHQRDHVALSQNLDLGDRGASQKAFRA